MEAVVFIGLQASGKSSFYKERFFSTHVRISLDLLKTRNRERELVAACLKSQQPFVVDNTNPLLEDRQRYIQAAKQAQYTIVGYYFESRIQPCLIRNRHRQRIVPEKGILSTYKKLVLPELEEGFDRLHYVRLTDNGFVQEEWKDEI